MDMKASIAAIPLFQGLEPRYLQEIASIVVTRLFKRGETIFAEGADANGFYVASRGRVKIFKMAPDGKEQILHIFGPGEPFGEVPVFSGQRYPAHAEALTEAAALFFPRQAFIALIKQEPSLALNMLSVLSLRLKRFTALIEDLSLKEVPGRLAAYLLYLSDRSSGADGLSLAISRTQLASILGTIPETLSRILARMTKEGLLAAEGKHVIRITSRAQLEQLANGERRLG